MTDHDVQQTKSVGTFMHRDPSFLIPVHLSNKLKQEIDKLSRQQISIAHVSKRNGSHRNRSLKFKANIQSQIIYKGNQTLQCFSKKKKNLKANANMISNQVINAHLNEPRDMSLTISEFKNYRQHLLKPDLLDQSKTSIRHNPGPLSESRSFLRSERRHDQPYKKVK